MPSEAAEPKYDVALSFAGEDRKYVEQVATALAESGVKVFYDDYEKVELWGKDLYTHLDWVYREASRYCVVFISENYAAKVWTNHERASAQARALEENSEYLLPARFDATVIPGVRPTVGYLDLKDVSPIALAQDIRDKLGPRPVTPGFPNRVDRLYDALNLKGQKAKEAKKQARGVAYGLYEAMGRMTDVERRAVAGVFVFGCGAEAEGVHISLDLLSRMTRLPKVELVEALAAVRSLNFTVKLRDPIHDVEDGDLVADDRDILLSFWTPRAPDAKKPTRIAHEAVYAVASTFCPDHGFQAIRRRDFHRLSSAVTGPFYFDDDEDDAAHECSPKAAT